MDSETNQSYDNLLLLEEQAEIEKIRKSASNVGYVVFTKDGEEKEFSNMWDQTTPIFANLFDIADRIAEEIGEESGCRVLATENRNIEITAVAMESVNTVVVKNKSPKRIGVSK